ncbi:hypothetical protein Csa_010294 [Cucumis sativus]|uniref:Uncharacterized protein n=1 Tax=Cucumis sativus TaxID=3659 RepID=A0A0A0LAL2_CUCSA|nr:hypothetical protein Csa_010294 [Cucumis sativus]
MSSWKAMKAMSEDLQLGFRAPKVLFLTCQENYIRTSTTKLACLVTVIQYRALDLLDVLRKGDRLIDSTQFQNRPEKAVLVQPGKVM